MTEREKKVVLDRVRLLGQTLQQIMPEGAETHVMFHADGTIFVQAMCWGEHEGLNLKDIPRREVISVTFDGEKWGWDSSERMNDYYRSEDILLDEKGVAISA